MEDFEQISQPINLSSDDETAILFYLAGKVPVSISDFSSHCTGNESKVRDTLQRRFQNEVRIDKTGFVDLTDAARGQIVSAVNPLISEALDEHERGRELVEEDNYEDAVDCYRSAADRLVLAESRLSTVGAVPNSLESRIDSVEETYDKLLKETTKDTVTHRKLLSEQYEEQGDVAAESENFNEAVETYQEAIETFQEAKEAVSHYNDNFLDSSSSKLDLRPFEKRLETLNSKMEAAKSNVSESTSLGVTTEQSDQEDLSGETSGKGSEDDFTSSPDNSRPTVEESPSKEAIIEMISYRREKLGRMPKLQEVIENLPWSQHDVLSHFKSWDNALEAAGIDKRQELIEDIRETGRVVGGEPSSVELNSYGSFSAGMIYDVFGSLDDALAAAGFGESSGTSEREMSSSGPEVGNASGDRTSPDDSQTHTDSTTEPEDTATTSGTDREERSSDTDPTDFASIEDLPPNKRFRDELAVKVKKELYSGAKRDASFEVADADGTTIQFDFWSKHELDLPESTEVWYVFEEVRLTQWDTDDGIGRNLSSTRDTDYRMLNDTEPPEESTSISSSDSVSQTESTNTAKETTEATATDRAGNDDIESNEDSSTHDGGGESDEEADGLLGSIESEFEAIE